jgi:uncharacterized repeat protein (TIGR01451 family)
LGGEDGRWATAFGNFSILDYGDAPDPTYPTLLVGDGARHIMDGVTYLGSTVDEDLDGQPNATATGDDIDGADDEDGVAFMSTLNPGASTNVQLTASASGTLNAWIDFNADGDWDDASEQIFADQSLSPGVNALAFSVPAAASVGQTYARFRFSTQGALAPTGLAPNGEVEDYQVNVISAADIAIAKTVDPQTNVDLTSTVTYTIVLSNTGAADDDNVLLTDTLPSEVDFGGWITQPAGASVSNDEISWSGAIAQGTSVTFAFTATHVGGYGETVTNTVEFSGTIQAGIAEAAFTVIAAPPEPPALIAPTDGTVTSTAALSLTWSPVADAMGYWLDFDGAAMDVGNLTAYATGVLAEGTYTWTVASYDVFSRTGGYADVWAFEVDTTPPDTPTLVSPADGTVTATVALSLIWTPVAGAAGYWLDFDGTAMDVGNATAYSPGFLTGGTYTWTVASYDTPGNTSPYAEVWSFTMQWQHTYLPLVLRKP